jgi:hypothetical protein
MNESTPDPADEATTGGADSSRKERVATLIEAATAPPTEFFHDRYGHAFATFRVGEHRETWSLRSSGIKRWLRRLDFSASRQLAPARLIGEVIGHLEALGLDGDEIPVHLRVARQDERIYLDLGDPEWRAVEISAAGWRVVADPPVKFRRPMGLRALPEPVLGGSVAQLRDFINVPSQDDFVLVVGWLLMSFKPEGPYPILVLQGEQGTAKSTLARILRSLVDPNASPVRSEPNVRDLMVTSQNSWTPVLDNLSGLKPALSDALCRLSTGGGLGTRKLYADEEETIIDAARPLILNGIEQLATRSDLLDRSLVITLLPIPDDARRTYAALWDAFSKAKPAILGALLDAISGALKDFKSVSVPHLPRLADFATWVTAAESALPWKRGDFLSAYGRNSQEAHSIAIESSPLAEAISALDWTQQFSGTATELLDKLNQEAAETVRRQRSWPRSAQALSAQLSRLKPNLRATGIYVETGIRTGKARTRIITISRSTALSALPQSAAPRSETSSFASASSAVTPSDPATEREELRAGGDLYQSENLADATDEADDAQAPCGPRIGSVPADGMPYEDV